jgi:hypothetical protein
LWISALYILLRIIGCFPLDATLFALLAATSACAMFWFVVPERTPWGSLSILLGLGIIGMAQYRKLSERWFTIASAITLSMTVTNWMVGILASLTYFSWRRTLRISVTAFCLVTLLWAVEKLAFPNTPFFLDNHREARYLFRRETGGPVAIFNCFCFHSVVMPAVRYAWVTSQSKHPILTVQLSRPGTGSPWGAVAVALWSALLGLGVWGATSIRDHPRLKTVLGLTLVGQLGLHLMYGTETFQYALHFGPLLVLLAAFSTLTRARWVALLLAGALLVCTGLNNSIQFTRAVRYLWRSDAPTRALRSGSSLELRRVATAACGRRPIDPTDETRFGHCSGGHARSSPPSCRWPI